jgi:superfamily I DNA/RNA helicase
MEDSKELREEIATQPITNNIVVTAGPGSGKTKLLIDRLIYLCKNSTRPNSNIACITYTNAAKEEILERLQKEENYSLPQGAFVGTIHAFLNEYLIVPYSYLLSPISKPFDLLPKGFSKYYANRLIDNKKFRVYDNMIALESIGYNENGDFLCFRSNKVTKEEMSTLKKLIHSEQKMDQQDIIYFAYKLLIQFPHLKSALSSRFSAILVDEFQDVTFYQDQILRLLNNTSFFFVGDPNQSIFKFAGAEPSIFEDRLKNPGTFKRYVLKNNFRSTTAIVNFNNKKSQLEQLPIGDNASLLQDVLFLSNISELKQAIEAFHEHRLLVGLEQNHTPFLILARKHEKLIEIQKTFKSQEIEQAPFLNKLKRIDHRRYEIMTQLLTARLLIDSKEFIKSLKAVEIALSRIIFNKNPNFINLSEIKYDQMLWRKLQIGVFNWLKTQDCSLMKIENFLQLLKNYLKEFSEKNLGIKIGVKLKILNYEWTNQKKESKKTSIQNIMDQIILDPNNAERAYLSTIHSAKGREATSILVIAEDLNELRSWLGFNDNEEARVGFVAFTRARRFLCIWCPDLMAELKGPLINN